MATTTNYGWTTPDDTALVKDGASAIRTLGSSVDTTTKALNPSTTLGDIEYRSATANTNTRLGIGSSGQVLTVSGGVPAWGTIAAGGYTVIASGSLSSTAVNITSIPSTYVDLVLFIENRTHGTTGGSAAIRVNNDSSTIYKNALTYGNDSAFTADQTIVRSGGDAPTSSSQSMEMIRFYLYADAGIQKVMDINAFTSASGIRNNLALYCATTAISQINIVAEGGRTLTGGTYVLYGVK